MTSLHPMTKTVRAALYARISQDDGSALGVARQESDCRTLAESKGWTVTHVFTDNDISASSGKVRPQYRALLRAIETGEVDALVVWDVDRLTRTPRELEDIIDLADRSNLALASVGGEIDLASPQGRLTARIKGTVARHEVEQMSRRIKRKSDERAAAGAPVGRIGYGFDRVDGREVINEPQAAIIRELARRLLDGESLRTLARDLNARGETTRTGKEWCPKKIRELMIRSNIAGLRTHRGEIVGKTNGDAIIDRDTYDRLIAMFNDPARINAKTGRPVTHLLSGIARCGLCGGKMRVFSGWQRASGYVKPGYTCVECLRIRRVQDPVDALITDLVIARLESGSVDMSDAGDRAAENDARDAIAAIDARAANAADMFVAGSITAAQMNRISEGLRVDRERWERALADAMPRTLPSIFTGPNPRERWERASIEERRAVVDALMEITIHPTAKRGGVFDPKTVRVAWKSA